MNGRVKGVLVFEMRFRRTHHLGTCHDSILVDVDLPEPIVPDGTWQFGWTDLPIGIGIKPSKIIVNKSVDFLVNESLVLFQSQFLVGRQVWRGYLLEIAWLGNDGKCDSHFFEGLIAPDYALGRIGVGTVVDRVIKRGDKLNRLDVCQGNRVSKLVNRLPIEVVIGNSQEDFGRQLGGLG